MADEVLKIIMLADTSKAVAAFKELETAANKVGTAVKASSLQSHPGMQKLNDMVAKTRQALDGLATSTAQASGKTASSLTEVQAGAAQVGDAMTAAGLRGGSAMAALANPMMAVAGTILAQATAIGAFNAALIDAGRTFHDVMATMAGRTGETGRALEEMGNSFRNVFSTVPQSANEVSQVMILLHQRFGLTGKSLEDISRRVLDFSRVTGTPLKATLDGIVAVFSSWDIKVKDMPKAFDMLLVATQKSGIDVIKLTGLLEKNDAVLKEMGFGFTESIALITEFEKRGVGSEQVLMGMKKAMSELAKEGFDPSDAFQRLIASIQTLDEAQARLLTIEVFGTRAAAELFDTIRSGQFSIGDMVDNLILAQGALDLAAQKSRTLTEQFNQLKNALTAMMMPLGSELVGMIQTVVLPVFALLANKLAEVIAQITWVLRFVVNIPKKGILGAAVSAGTQTLTEADLRTPSTAAGQAALSETPAGVARLSGYVLKPDKFGGLGFEKSKGAFSPEELAAIMDKEKTAANKFAQDRAAFKKSYLEGWADLAKSQAKIEKEGTALVTKSVQDEIESGLKISNSRILDDFKKRIDAQKALESLQLSTSITRATTETERMEIENQKQLADFAEKYRGMQDFDLAYAAFKEALEIDTAAKVESRQRKQTEDLEKEIALNLATISGRTANESAIFGLMEKHRQEKDEAIKAGRTDINRIEFNQGIELIKLQQSQYDTMFGKVKTQAEGVFDAIFLRGKKGFAGLLDYIKGVFVTGLKDLFGNLVATLFTGSRPGGGSAVQGGLFGGIAQLFGGGGGRGGGGGLFGSLGGLFGGGGGLAGTPPFLPSRGGFGGIGGLLGIGGAGASAATLTPGVAGALPTTFTNTGLLPTGGAAAGGGSFLGLSGAQLGAFFTNPFTIAAGIGIAATLAFLKFRKTREDKFRAEILRDFALNVPDNRILKQIKSIGENVFGKEADRKRFETLRLDAVQSLLLNFAQASGQDPGRLPLYQRFFGRGLASQSISFDPSRGIPAFANGGVVPGIDRGYDSVLSFLRPGELVVPKAQFTPIGGGATMTFAPNIHVDARGSTETAVRNIEEAVERVMKRSERKFSAMQLRALQGDFRRKEYMEALIGS